MAKLTVSVSSCHDLPPCYVCLGASLVAQVGWTQLSDFAFTFHFSLCCIGEGSGNPLQCSCLENPRDGRVWWAAVYGVAQSQTTEVT